MYKVSEESLIREGIIPREFLEWLVTSRLRFVSSLENGRPVNYFSAHLPVLASWGNGGSFPVNLTVKGIGLVPKQSALEHFTDIFESTIAEATAMPWDESMSRRVAALKKLYEDHENFDPSVLGGLEIFEGKAFKNFQENPYTSLLYVGMPHEVSGIRYISFQVNGIIEVIDKKNPYYRFLLASRKLFEFDRFHIFQHDYPFGYLIKVAEVKDKTPKTRKK